MDWVLDAWVERADPWVRILETGSGRVVREWHGEAARALADWHELAQLSPNEARGWCRWCMSEWSDA